MNIIMDQIIRKYRDDLIEAVKEMETIDGCTDTYDVDRILRNMLTDMRLETIDNVFNKDMQKDTVVNNITSTLFSQDKNKAIKKEINSLYINNIDFIQEYGGYIDIGLYDTMEDMICALLGALLFIIKKLAEP